MVSSYICSKSIERDILIGDKGRHAAARYTYDASGTPMAVTYGGTTYYYATNIQGDVVAILDSSGAAVVTYTYDAWGNILTTLAAGAMGCG